MQAAGAAVSNIPTGNRVRLRSSTGSRGRLQRRLENIERSVKLLGGASDLGLGKNVDIYV